MYVCVKRAGSDTFAGARAPFPDPPPSPIHLYRRCACTDVTPPGPCGSASLGHGAHLARESRCRAGGDVARVVVPHPGELATFQNPVGRGAGGGGWGGLLTRTGPGCPPGAPDMAPFSMPGPADVTRCTLPGPAGLGAHGAASSCAEGHTA